MIPKQSPRKNGQTDDETSLLIDILEANPCLWDIYHTDYSKRDLKEIA